VASRLATNRKVHPEWLSPVFKRTMLLVVSSKKIAIPSACPAIAPISARCGRCGGLLVGFGGENDANPITGGGRREGEKTGRSRAALNELMGSAHRGLPNPTQFDPRVRSADELAADGKAAL